MQDKLEDGQTGYEGFVYHDEPEDAATDLRSVGIFDNFGSALLEVQQNLGHHWNGGGSLHRGPVEIDRFTRDVRMPEVEVSCHVAPDGTPDSVEWEWLTKVGVTA